MMANVSGVSQFLETVGVPGPQAALESVPGQDFAAVMQKANDAAGSPQPQPLGGLVGGQTDEEATGTGTAPSTQTSTTVSQKTVSQGADATQTAASAQSFRRAYVGSQTQGGGARGSGRSLNTVTMPASQAEATTLSGAVSAQGVAGGKADAIVLDASLKTTALSGSTALASEAKEPQVPAGVAQGSDANVLSTAPTMAAVKATGIPFIGITPRPTSTQKRGDDATPAVNEATKPAGGKVDSKLTAIIPQGTAGVPQSTASLPIANSAPSIALALPVAVPALEPSPSVEVTTPLVQTPSAPTAKQLPAVAAGPVSGSSTATVQGATGKQTLSVKISSVTTFNPPAGTALTTPTMVAASAPAPLLNAPSANAGAPQSAALLTPTAQLPTEKAVSLDTQAAPMIAATGGATPAPMIAATGGATPAPNVQTAQATQQPEVSTIAPPDQPTAAFQAALALNGSPQPALKPGLHMRSGLPAAKATSDTVTLVGTVSSQGVAAKVPASAASANPAPPIAPVPPSPSHAATAGSNGKAPQKQADAAVSASTVPAAAPSAGSLLKSAPAADSTSATMPASKDSSNAAAPVVSSLAVTAPAEMTPVVSAAVGMTPQAPLIHGTAAASAPVVNGVTAASFGAQETGASASGSLPHTTLSATPTSLEVGVSSGTHGWLKIRAELNEAGQVDASLTGANSAAANKLRGDLPALNSYLQGEKVQMGSLDVRSALHTAVFESGSTFSQAGSGGGSNGSAAATGTAVSADASAAGGREQQAPSREANSVPIPNASRDGDEILPGRVTDAAAYGNQTELDGAAGLPSVGYGAGGGWLNVRV